MKHAFLLGSFLTLGACVAEPAMESAPATSAEIFEVIAQIELDGGSVTFIDETMGKDVSIGILEAGSVNLGALYEQEATVLEIFLAIAPPDMAVPEILYTAHDLARLRNPRLPEQPRALANSFEELVAFKSIPYHTFAKDTSNCWEWGNVSSYDRVWGNDPSDFGGHESTQATAAFLTWSGIPGGFMTTTQSEYDEHAELTDQEYQTAWGHERAVAMCVTHAINLDPPFTTSCGIDNTVNYRVTLIGENDDSNWGSEHIYVTGYGQGVRYRSSSLESRRYTLRVVDVSVKSIYCREHYQVDLRSRFNPPLGS